MGVHVHTSIGPSCNIFTLMITVIDQRSQNTRKYMSPIFSSICGHLNFAFP